MTKKYKLTIQFNSDSEAMLALVRSLARQEARRDLEYISRKNEAKNKAMVEGCVIKNGKYPKLLP